MDFKICRINWVNPIIDDSMIYTKKEWLKLSVDDDSQNIEWAHARIVSPTFARVRTIILEWIIDRAFSSAEEKVNHLRSIFALQDEDLFEVYNNELYIKDIYDNEWIINVKIKEPIDIVEWDEEFYWEYWKWRVVLESTKSPVYKSYNQNLINWVSWRIWGWKLWVKLGKAMNESSSVIQANTLSSKTDTRFEITATWNITSPLTIRNLVTNEFFALNITAVSWDKIIVDTSNYIVTKNWVNILWNRISWSSWLKIKWNNQFTIYDGLGSINIFWAKLYFRNAML